MKAVEVTQIVDHPYSLQRAADYLGIAVGTLKNLTYAKEVASHNPRGQMRFYRKKDLDDFAYRNRTEANFKVIEKVEGILNS